MTFAEEQSKKLHDDLERQLKEELKSDSDKAVPVGTLAALRQKFGLAAMPHVSDIARNIKGCKR